MLIVITGPIASGKSTVARALHRELEGRGVTSAVVDLDVLEDMVTGDGPKADPASWTRARRALARLVNGFLADGVTVVIADGSFNRAIDRSTFEELLDPDVTPRYVTLTVAYEEALRRVRGDPSRGVSKDPAFLEPYFAKAEASRDVPATDLVIDTASTAPMAAAAEIARIALATG